MHLQAQGELQRTDQPLDLAFDGDGLLLVKDKSGTLGGARTGAFHLTKEGRIQDAKGLTLQGWPLLPEAETAESSTGSAGTGTGASTPGGAGGTSSGVSTDIPGAGTLGSRTAKTAVTRSSPPSAAFIGPLGDLEDIQLIKPEPTPPPAAPAHPFYGAGISTQKEADGLYSFHGSVCDSGGNTYEFIDIRRTFVDSLGQERSTAMAVSWNYNSISLFLVGPNASCRYFPDTGDVEAYDCTFDKAAKQMVITFSDTGAELRFDLSDMEVVRFEFPFIFEDPLLWKFPQMVFEEGTFAIESKQHFAFGVSNQWNGVLELTVERGEDGSLTGRLFYDEAYDVELHFDEEGWIAGYTFTRNARSDSDPSVGIRQTGSVIKGVRFTSEVGLDVDLSAIRVIDKTKPGFSEGATSEATQEAFAPLSPSSLSIDENGVLKRLKDDGDWEPVYLLACGQFAAMSFAEERNGVYYATPASGVLRTGVSGKEGMGTITSGTLERSTTDLAHELSEMIRAQHAYAANTKVLSTLDDMLTELERL
ncbi:MAG: hypothetical protein LBJ70_00585 [Holosporales bacterium]|jgi:flagellar hook protein FlgE|nr:hypothetical protein [Holosporales bacterium]